MRALLLDVGAVFLRSAADVPWNVAGGRRAVLLDLRVPEGASATARAELGLPPRDAR